ncbi:MAG: hypothetical protein ACKVP7_08185 [Hyphomicrobiaceae bacterium]
MAIPDLLGGRVTMTFAFIQSVLPLVREGKLASRSKRPFEPTFVSTTADRHIAAVRGSDRQRRLRPRSRRRASDRYRSRAVARMTGLSWRVTAGIALDVPVAEPVFCYCVSAQITTCAAQSSCATVMTTFPFL